MEPRVIRILRQKMADYARTQTTWLASGSVADYPTYRETVGIIRGFTVIEDMIEESLKETGEGI